MSISRTAIMGHFQVWSVFIILLSVSWLPQSWTQISGPYVRNDLQLRIVVKYPEAQLTSHGASIDLLIVGNGLGLAWDDPAQLTKVGVDTWTVDVHFNGSMSGYGCDSCPHSQRLNNGAQFEFRIMTAEGGDMVGPNFGMAVPMSKIEKDFAIREYVVYPYFFTRRGSINALNVSSSDPLISTREWAYYLPPSFSENTYKKYPTILALDLGRNEMSVYRFLLEQILVSQAIAEESVVIGSSDYGVDFDRTELLTPTPGVDYYCFNGDYPWVDRCGGCIPDDMELYTQEFFYLMRDKCGNPLPSGGHGESYLDYILDQVVPEVNEQASSRLLTDQSHLGIGGCSLGGLMACHAIWTRPQVFGSAACTSSSFWWPTLVSGDNGFDFLNVTLKDRSRSRPPQKVYIDVTDLEDDPYYGQVGSALEVVDQLTSSPQFRLDETLLFTLVNGQVHGGWECLTRSWIYMNQFVRPGGGPKNPVTASKFH